MPGSVPGSSVDGGRMTLGRLRAALQRIILVSVLGFAPGALPAPSFEYQDRAAAEYDQRRKVRAVFQWEQEIVRTLLATAPPRSRVLDVPVGTGRFIPTYLTLGLEVVGLDASDAMLAEAARTFDPATDPVTLTKGSATALPFADGSFDALVSFRFLPGKLTLRQTRAALREYGRVTRGELHILLKVGERTFPASWRDEFSRLGTRPEHELREILADAGLVVDRIERAPDGPKAVFVCRSAGRSGVAA